MSTARNYGRGNLPVTIITRVVVHVVLGSVVVMKDVVDAARARFGHYLKVVISPYIQRVLGKSADSARRRPPNVSRSVVLVVSEDNEIVVARRWLESADDGEIVRA